MWRSGWCEKAEYGNWKPMFENSYIRSTKYTKNRSITSEDNSPERLNQAAAYFSDFVRVFRAFRGQLFFWFKMLQGKTRDIPQFTVVSP